MYVLINPNGSKYFRFDYRINDKRKTLALGVYPETSLKKSREKRDQARDQINNGIDPNENKKAIKKSKSESAANNFEIIAREWFENRMMDKSESHKKRSIRILENYLFPGLGDKPIKELKPADILTALKKIEGRNTIDTAHKAFNLCSQIMRYSVQTLRADRDITQDLKGALKNVKGGHFAAIIDPKEIGGLLRAIDEYNGSFIVKSALQLAPLVFVRPGELRAAEWEHFNLEAKEWRYLVIKTQTQHIVPLSNQALSILERIKQLTGGGRYVFPSERTPNGSRPLSDMALLAALRRMGFTKEEMTVHGFRAIARTVIREELKFSAELIDHQLAHSVRDPNGRAYDRTSFIVERCEMMQAWSNYLDGLKNGAVVIELKK